MIPSSRPAAEETQLELTFGIVKYSFLFALMVLITCPAVAQPAISVNPTSHNYGTVDVGKTKSQTFRVTNTGSDTLDALASLLDNVHFSLSPEGAFSVAPGSFTDIIARFAPTRPGEQFDSLLIAHNGTNSTSPVAALLTGVGIPRPRISVDPQSHDFDTVAVRTSEDATFWIGNPGSGVLTVRASIGLGAPNYEVISGTEIFTVAAGDSMPVTVRYAPLNVTRHTGELRINHNGVGTVDPVRVVLAGVGAQAITLDPYEPNNSAGEATQIEQGFVSDSTEIWPSGDVDYYTFQGVYGEWIQITVDVVRGSTLNSKLWLYDSAGNLLAENDNNGSTDQSQISDTLRASGPYFIRVAFAGNNAGFPNSRASKFAGEDPTGEYRLSVIRTGQNPLGTPSLVSPEDNVFNERVDPLLSWTSVEGARNYDIIVAETNTFAPGTVVFQSSRTDTTVVAPGLPAGKVLFWHARAGYELGTGPFSTVRQFQTTFAPVVVSPIADRLLPEGSMTVDLSPVFSDPEGGALIYDVVSMSDTTVLETRVQAAQLTLTVIGSGSTDVTVGAQDPQGARATTSFNVIAGAATATDADELPPGSFGIGSNYPNPFSGKTVIPVSIPESSEVKLLVFDLLGNEIRTLVHGRMTAGIHEVRLSAEDLAPGIYVIRLEANGATAMSSVVVGR